MRLDSVASGAKSGSMIQYGLLGACEHPADSPYALLITIGIEACAKHPLRLDARMRKTPCYNGSRSGNSYARHPSVNVITCDMWQIF